MLTGLDFTKISLIWHKSGIAKFGVVIHPKEVSIVNSTFRLVKRDFLSVHYCLDFGLCPFMLGYIWMYPLNPGIPGIGQPPKKNAGIKYTAYYPWVPYVLFLQSLIFLVPSKLWKHLEGNRIEHFRKCGETELKKRDIKMSDKIEAKLKRLAIVLLKHQKYGLNIWYSRYFILCEALNLVVVAFNLWFTDFFLAKEFGNIGFDIITRILDKTSRPDVLSFTFPKVTKCLFRMFGASGSIVEHDYICVIPINEAYEKTYIIMWFWLWGICITSTFALLYRAALIISPSLREYVLSQGLTLSDRKRLPVLLKDLKYCDWFVLKLVSSNFNMIRFGQICAYMQDEICGKPEVMTEVKVELKVTTKKYEPVKRCSDYIVEGDI